MYYETNKDLWASGVVSVRYGRSMPPAS